MGRPDAVIGQSLEIGKTTKMGFDATETMITSCGSIRDERAGPTQDTGNRHFARSAEWLVHEETEPDRALQSNP